MTSLRFVEATSADREEPMEKVNAVFSALGFGAMLTLAGCGGESDVEAFCGIMLDLEENDPTDGLEEGTPEWFEATTSSVQEAVDAAPDEIKDDFEDFQAAFEQMSELAEGDPADIDLGEMQEILTGVTENGERIDDFVEANCEA